MVAAVTWFFSALPVVLLSVCLLYATSPMPEARVLTPEEEKERISLYREQRELEHSGTRTAFRTHTSTHEQTHESSACSST
jgi:hypothetical protein